MCASFSNLAQSSVPPDILDRIKNAYNRLERRGDALDNPVAKIGVVASGEEGTVYLDEIVHGEEEEVRGGGGSASITDRPLKDQLKSLHSQNAALRLSVANLQAQLESQSVKNERYFNTISSNIKRIAIAPRNCMRQTQEDGPNVNATAPLATLTTKPKTLYDLWDEYVFGVGGRKPAKDFSAAERGKVKFKYSRRKVVWSLILKLVDSGMSAQVSIDRIYAAYVQQKTVTQIIDLIRKDKKEGYTPPLLRVGD